MTDNSETSSINTTIKEEEEDQQIENKSITNTSITNASTLVSTTDEKGTCTQKKRREDDVISISSKDPIEKNSKKQHKITKDDQKLVSTLQVLNMADKLLSDKLEKLNDKEQEEKNDGCQVIKENIIQTIKKLCNLVSCSGNSLPVQEQEKVRSNLLNLCCRNKKKCLASNFTEIVNDSLTTIKSITNIFDSVLCKKKVLCEQIKQDFKNKCESRRKYLSCPLQAERDNNNNNNKV